MRTATLVYRALFVAALAAASLVLGASSRSTADAASVDVQLLSIPSVSSIDVAARGLRVRTSDRLIDTDDEVSIAAMGDSVRVASRLYGTLAITSTNDIVVASSKRRRRLNGALTVRAVDGALVIVARIDMEKYLAGVLASEARATDPREYLVALLVLQRNYVESHRGRHAPYADVCDNTHCQLYHGNAVPISMRALTGVAATLSMRSQGAAPCYYSANCGGSTLTPGDLWGAYEPGYASVRCEHCRNSRWYRWTRDVPATPRALSVLAGARPAPFVDDDFKIRLGRAVGFASVPSNTIDRISRRGSVVRISGRGFGHRVGLCQDGARELARRGSKASEILAAYFPTAAISVSANE